MVMLLNHRPSGLGILNRRGGNQTAVMQLLGMISCFSFNEESRGKKNTLLICRDRSVL